MYLTIKWLIETIIFAVIFFILGSVNMVLGLIFTYTATPVIELLILGIICYIIVILIVLWEIFAVGKARVISMGHKLIRKELRPEKFIEYYTSDIFIIKTNKVELVWNF